MADTTVDKVKIEIEAEAVKAESSIDDLVGKIERLRDALGTRLDTKKLKESMKSVEDFQNKIKDFGKERTFNGSLSEINKEISDYEKKLDKLLVKEEKSNILGESQTGSAYKKMQLDIAEACNYLDTLYEKRKQLEADAEPRQLFIGGMPFDEWYEKTQRVQEAAQEATTEFQEMGQSIQGSDIAPELETVRERLADVEAEAESTNEEFENMGGGGVFSRLAEQIRSISASDVFGKLSASVKDFQSRIGVRVPTQEYTDLAAKIQQAEDALQRLLDKQDRMEAQGISQNSASWKGLQYDIRVATDRVADFNRDMELLQASGGDTQRVGGISAVFNGITNAAKGSINVIKRLGNTFKTFLGKIKSVAAALSSTSGGMKRLNTSAVPLSRTFSKMGNLLKIMLMRLALKAVLNNVGEGFKALAGESEEFNAKISDLMASCKRLAHSIAAIASPLVDMFGPALTAVINLLTKATNAINQFLSALTGKSVYNKAKKQNYDYAASLSEVGSTAKKTAKEIKDATTGIDELNIISQNNSDDDSSGSGGSDTGVGDLYDTEPIDEKIKSLADRIKEILKTDDWSEIGQMIADKLNEAMAAIPWDKIQAQAKHIAKGIGTLINGFVSELDWSQVGYTIGQGLNTALIFANTLITTIDFGKIGQSLSTLLNSAVETIDWAAVGELFCNGINAVIDFAYDFVSTLDFTAIGESIGKALSTAINGIEWSKGGATVGKAITGLFNALNGFIKKTDFKRLGKGIVEAIGGFFKNINWGSIGSTFSSAFSALCSFLTGVVEGIDWAGVPGYILQSIKDFFKNFDWKGVSQSLGELLGSAVKGAAELCGSIWDMLKEAWGNVKDYFSGYIDEAGGNIIEGLFNGIVDALKGVGTWISENIFTPFIDGFKKAFGIHSPSKEMATMGGYVVEGFLEGISGKMSACMAKVKEWAGNVKDWFYGKATTLKDNFVEFGGNVVSGFREKVGTAYGTIKTNVTKWASDVKEWFTGNGQGAVNSTTFSNFANNTVTGFREKIGTAYTTVRDKITTWATDIKDYFSGGSHGAVNSNTFSGYADKVISGFRETVGSTYTTVRTNVSTWASDIKEYFTGGGHGAINLTTFSNYANNVVSGFREKIGSVYTSVRTNITTWANDVREYFTGGSHGAVNATKFASFASDVVDGFKNKVGSIYTNCRTIMTTWANDVKSAFEGSGENTLVKKFYGIAKNVIDGFNKGISDFVTNSVNTVKSWASSLVSAVEDILDINSPSRVFKKLGGFTVEGFNKGIDANADSTTDHIADWVGKFSEFQADIKARLNVDSSDLQNYRPNLDNEFSSGATIKRELEETLVASGSVAAKVDSTTEFEEALERIVTPYLDKIADNTKATTDAVKENRKVSVEIDGREVVKATDKVKQNNGFSFTPQTA